MRVAIILQAWLTLPSYRASSSKPTLARMTFCSLLMISVLSKRRVSGLLRAQNTFDVAPGLYQQPS